MPVAGEASTVVLRVSTRGPMLLGTLGLLASFGALRMQSSTVQPALDIYNINDSEYYSMPPPYELDEYYGCLGRGGVYCFGQFELSAPPGNELLQRIQKYSEDWVRHSNHSWVYRGVCLPRTCPNNLKLENQEWFASCVNWSMTSKYNMSARLMQLDYCTRQLHGHKLTAMGEAFVWFLIVLLTVAIISTVLDSKLSGEIKKDIGWALSWSIRRSWRTLRQPAQKTDIDLRFLDGMRVIAMAFLIVLHMGAFAIMFNVSDTRFYEESAVVMLTGNLSIAVQVFFIISSFLMARKVLQQEHVSAKKNFVQTMKNRIVRILPSYTVLILYTVSLHEYWGSGPMWPRVVGGEVDTCRRTWWMNLLFLNNFNTGLKCQGQTWYLAADMQLYTAGLLLTLLLRGRRAVPVLAVLLATFSVLYVCMAYAWSLVPLHALHVPDNLRMEYSGVATFDLLYQTPWGNAFASLTGLLLAHAHHSLKTSKYDLHSNKAYQWTAKLSGPALLVWVVVWPCIHPLGPPTRLRSALLAGLTGPVFCLLVAVLILEMLQGRKKSLRRFLTGRGFSVLARLSLSVLLVHFSLARVQLVLREAPVNIDYFKLTFNTFGVWTMSYCVATVLALLVELPTQRLYRELSGAGRDKRAD